jgi:hypothetical protein
VLSFNVRPNAKLDRIAQIETQVDLAQFQAGYYMALVYYQKAVVYDYTGATVPAGGTAISATDVNPGSDMRPQYYLFGKLYNGKLCLDIGYNIQDILMTWKIALTYRDCYKNLFMTPVDFSNWLGPKAMWVDSCEFHSDEDLLAYSYNPYGRFKDSDDVSMLWHKSKIRERTGAVSYRRPNHKNVNFYRDCLPVDDTLLKDLSGLLNLQYVYDIISIYFQLFNVSVEEVLFPKFDPSLLVEDGQSNSGGNFDQTSF